jgi:lactate dehydrogenase-like 2-hydroxyacid dehydrogenase
MAKKWKVYVTRELPEVVIEELQEYCDVEVNLGKRALTKEELIEKVRGRDAVLTQATDIVGEAVLAAAAPQCKIFANYGVGYNNFDLQAVARHKIMVSNTPEVVTEATAEMTWALLLAVARRLVEADQFLRAGRFKGLDPSLLNGIQLAGKTLGVIGAGRIGRSFAKKAQAFSLKVIYNDVQPNSLFEAETGGVFVPMDKLLAEADFISLHVPLLPETRHLIGLRELKLMKKTAILLNASRGPVVNEEELVAGLKAGEIWGAGLDVFENEPKLAPGLADLTNVVLSPHTGTATIETRIEMGRVAAANILAALRGETPPNLVS